jgi:hypothetical protein
MKVLIVYGRMYASCLTRAVQGLGKNPWTIFLPMALFAAFLYLARIASHLGIIGGFLIPLIEAAIGSAYLYFVGEIVGRSRVRMGDLWMAIRSYFWSLINLFFVLWIASLVLGMLVGRSPNGGTLLLLFNLAVLIILNAAPEVIYQVGTYGGLATVQRCIQFLQESWIEWFLPMIAIGAAYWFVWGRVVLPQLYIHLGYTVGSLVSSVLLGALLHLVMLFRGFLFQELNGSSHRQRMFKYRNAISDR